MKYLFFSETPKAATLHVTQTTATSLTIRWRVTDDGQSPINRVSVNYKMTYGEWVSEDLGKLNSDRSKVRYFSKKKISTIPNAASSNWIDWTPKNSK